jgi:putative hydrolase of the HAD superfamily
MRKPAAILFDADGVLTLPEEVFSVVYARSRGLDSRPFEVFFKQDWPAIVTGKKDLKESIAERPELWQWDGSVDELLAYWFKTEDVRNDELLRLIRKLQDQGLPCYLATDQEKYRAAYMMDVMFKDLFRDHFVSAELGYAKADPRFFEAVIERLHGEHPDIKPEEITFFDDSQSKIDTACSVGVDGRLYQGIHQVEALLMS